MDQQAQSCSSSSEIQVETSVHSHVSCFTSNANAERLRLLILKPNHYLHLGQIFWFQVDTLKELKDLNGRVSKLAFDILSYVENFEDKSRLRRQSVPRYSIISRLTSNILHRRSYTDVVATIAADILKDLRSKRNVIFVTQSKTVYDRVRNAVPVIPSSRTVVFNDALFHIEWVLGACGPLPQQ